MSIIYRFQRANDSRFNPAADEQCNSIRGEKEMF